MNILVLDDDVGIHIFYRHILKRMKGVGLITLTDSLVSFGRALLANHYHVIICDIHMEPVNGPDILRAHKDELIGKEIVMLSCADNLADHGKALADDGLNVRACFQKPLVPQDLFDLLECD